MPCQIYLGACQIYIEPVVIDTTVNLTFLIYSPEHLVGLHVTAHSGLKWSPNNTDFPLSCLRNIFPSHVLCDDQASWRFLL